MAEWKKIKTVLYDNGERDITYAAERLHVWVQSRRRHIPHANGTGYWDSTLYVLINPETGEQFPGLRREYIRLRDAQEAAERLEKLWEEGAPAEPSAAGPTGRGATPTSVSGDACATAKMMEGVATK